MDLNFRVFARVNHHAMHMRRVAKDATPQQDIFGAEADFAPVLVDQGAAPDIFCLHTVTQYFGLLLNMCAFMLYLA